MPAPPPRLLVLALPAICSACPAWWQPAGSGADKTSTSATTTAPDPTSTTTTPTTADLTTTSTTTSPITVSSSTSASEPSSSSSSESSSGSSSTGDTSSSSDGSSDTSTGEPCVDPTPLFVEDFSTPGDWVSGALWQIGPASASMCAEPGADDPAVDHGGDGALAGTLIGACLPTESFAKNCLTAPPIDNPSVGSPTAYSLRYWSWLSTPGEPLLFTVELFTGLDWEVVQTFDSATIGVDWEQRVVDLPAIDIIVVHLRFCAEKAQGSPGSYGGWSIDDVSIERTACIP